jgi:non-ribosomal peptide synthetase component F
MIPAAAPDAAALFARYRADVDRAARDPEQFWAEQARALEWATPFTRVLDDSQAPFFRWFEGGKLNLCANAVDRHAAGPRRDKVAFIWLSEDLSVREAVTYAQLRDRVVRAAAALASLGVKKGDAVVLYMPLTLEAVVQMLACARLGAVHSVVYAGMPGSPPRRFARASKTPKPCSCSPPISPIGAARESRSPASPKRRCPKAARPCATSSSGSATSRSSCRGPRSSATTTG